MHKAPPSSTRLRSSSSVARGDAGARCSSACCAASRTDGLGENMAISSLMLEMCTRLRSREKASSSERAQFRRAGDAWIANMSPEVANGALCRDWLLALPGCDPEARQATLGASRRCGTTRPSRTFWTKLFPHGKVILLVRNPVDVLAPLRSRAWYRTATAAGPAAGGRLLVSQRRPLPRSAGTTRPRALRGPDHRRPKDAARDWRRGSPCAKGRSIQPLDLVLRGWEATPPRLGAPEILALRRKHVFELAQRCGYRLEADPRLSSRSLMRAMFSRGADAR